MFCRLILRRQQSFKAMEIYSFYKLKSYFNIFKEFLFFRARKFIFIFKNTSYGLKISIMMYLCFERIIFNLWLTYFDPLFNIFWLFLLFSKWRENPPPDSPQIFSCLKLQKQFWKKLQSEASSKLNYTLKFTSFIELQIAK